MIYLTVVICSIICLVGMQFFERKSASVLRTAVFSIVYYFGLYTVMSGILFWIEQFSVKRTVILVFLVSFAVCAASLHKNGIKDIQIEPERRDVWLPYIAIIFLCIFTAGHFEFFGMGQDQGVYQTEAINLFYNSTDWEHSIAEYDELEEGEYKAYYQNEVQSLAGFDLMINSVGIPGCRVDDATSKTLGMWHGIPTYAGILALSAKMFGIEHMMYIQILFFICFLFIIEFILADFQIGVYLRTLCVLLAGISPQIIWVKKSSLTEMFLALLFAAYIYFMVHKDDSKKVLAILPVTVFCFFHVTVFTMMPIFILNFWYLFLTTGHKKYLKCTGVILAAYAAGFFMMWTVQPRYTLLNYQQGLFFVPLRFIIAFVVAICVFTGLITVVLGKKAAKTVDMEKILKQVFRYISIVTVLFILLYTVMNHYTFYQIKMMTIVCYIILTGIFLLLSILSIFILKKYKFDHISGILGLLFLWCILIYSMLMRKNIGHYYYYGRYLVPYLCIIILLFAYLIKDKQRYIAHMLPLLGVLILLPYANVLRENQDDSRIEWSVLSDVIESAEGSPTILLDSELMHLFYYPLRASSGGKVYPVKDSLDATIGNIPSDGGSYLYITKESFMKDKNWMHVVYRNKTYFQEDDLRNTSKVLGLVTDISYKGVYDITVYQMESETKSISASSDHERIQGWTDTDGNGFRWTNRNEAFVKCYLKKKDYSMIICSGNAIPFDHISKNEIQVKVYLNENYIQTICYTADNVGVDQEVNLPSEQISEGENTIKFECDTWSPSEYGSADNSNYGFSISRIYFMAKSS